MEARHTLLCLPLQSAELESIRLESRGSGGCEKLPHPWERSRQQLWWVEMAELEENIKRPMAKSLGSRAAAMRGGRGKAEPSHLSLTSLSRGREGGTQGLASALSWVQAALVCQAQALPAATWTCVPWTEQCSEPAFWCKMGTQLGWAPLWDYELKNNGKRPVGKRNATDGRNIRRDGEDASYVHALTAGLWMWVRLLSSVMEAMLGCPGAQADSAQHYLLTGSGLPCAAGRVLFSKRKVFYIKGLIFKRHHFNLAAAALGMHTGEQEKSTGRLLSENSFWKKLKFSWGM